MDRSGFKFSLSKTVVVHFCRIRGVHPDPDIYLKGQRIPCVEETRFLGLHFDRRLTWVPHLKLLKARCLEAISILKVLSHTSWGADRQMLLKLYKALILSKILYGCEIYSSATSANLKILDSIHHAGIRLATGAFKSSPIPSLLVDAGELPLELYRQSAMTRYWYRLQRMPDSLAYKVARIQNFNHFYQEHAKFPQPFGFRVKQVLLDFNMMRNEVLSFKISVTPPWKLPDISFCRYFLGTKKNITEEEMRSIFLEHIAVHSDSTLIFTDGSKSSAGVGFGVFSLDFNKKGVLPVATSIFTAEFYGILAALEKVALIDHGNFTIFSDSKSVLQALNIFNPTNPLALKIQQWVYFLECRGTSVKFCWVPAHVKVSGNEEADKLAKQAASELIPRNCPIPHRDFYPDIRVCVGRVWQDRWNSVGVNKMREITSRTTPWKYNIMPRRWERALCRLRIGHTHLTHSFLMTRDEQPFCEDCLVPLTVRHLLVECPSLGDIRRRYLSEGLGGDGRYNLAKILGENVVYDTSGIFKFIVEAGLLQKL